MRLTFHLLLGMILLCGCAVPATAADHLGGIKLLPGFKDEPAQGFDSIVGKITNSKGLEINYEKGAVPIPGGIQIGGGFTDRPKQTPKDQVHWYVEQTVQDQPVHVAYRKDEVLMVAFPKLGMNFSAKVTTPDQMAAVLLMIMTYPDPPVEKVEAEPVK